MRFGVPIGMGGSHMGFGGPHRNGEVPYGIWGPYRIEGGPRCGCGVFRVPIESRGVPYGILRTPYECGRPIWDLGSP